MAQKAVEARRILVAEREKREDTAVERIADGAAHLKD